MYQETEKAKRKELFLEKRSRYNELIVIDSQDNKLEEASLFIFLNKTCFNGLYRVNAKGLFNVPFNNAINPLICDEENIRACSKLLQNVLITVGDYTHCDSFIDKNTFVYIDPPYRPLTKTSAFTSYSADRFNDEQQIELGEFIKRQDRKGAKILASNPSIAKWEKEFGKHPTQKPLAVLARIILASTKENYWILDPFTGSSTTGIAASLLGRRFLGIDSNLEYLELSKKRREDIEDEEKAKIFRERIQKQRDVPLSAIFELSEKEEYYGIDLPF